MAKKYYLGSEVKIYILTESLLNAIDFDGAIPMGSVVAQANQTPADDIVALDTPWANVIPLNDVESVEITEGIDSETPDFVGFKSQGNIKLRDNITITFTKKKDYERFALLWRNGKYGVNAEDDGVYDGLSSFQLNMGFRVVVRRGSKDGTNYEWFIVPHMFLTEYKGDIRASGSTTESLTFTSKSQPIIVIGTSPGTQTQSNDY